ARLVMELRSALTASEVFQSAPLPPWGQDLIAEKAIQKCEQRLVERWKSGDGKPYGGNTDLNQISYTWPPMVQAWEAHKASDGIDTGYRERIPESILRRFLSQR